MKKALGVILVLSMAVGTLAGCGSAKSSGDTYKIGGIGPTTGAAAIYGTAVKNGAQIAVDEINAAGGINGKQIEFKFEDDQHDAEKSVNAYNSLKDWGMQMLMGTVTSTPCIAVANETANDKMFELTPSASSTDVIKNGNVFQVCFTDPNQGVASADYIADNKIGSKVAIIYDSSDVYSTGIEEKFVSEAKRRRVGRPLEKNSSALFQELMLARFCETSCCSYRGANKTCWRSVGGAKRKRG